MTEAAVVPIKRSDDNPYRVVNQYRKARKLANVLLELGADEFNVANGGPALIALATRAANVDTPSETTWALVRELVKEATTG